MKKDNSNQKKEDFKVSKSAAKQTDKKDIENTTPNKLPKKSEKSSHTSLAASKQHSAVDHVKPRSNKDVRGSSGLTNTGPFVSYENED